MYQKKDNFYMIFLAQIYKLLSSSLPIEIS